MKPDTKPGFYYVSVVRDDGEYRLLRGPFDNHAAALAAVNEAKERAIELDKRAFWYGFGTCRTEHDFGPGLLDRLEARKEIS